MRTVPWSEAVRFVLADVQAASTLAAEQKLLEAAREFYRFTLAWRAPVEPFLSAAGVSDYDVVDTRHTEVVKILSAFYGADELAAVDSTDVVRFEAQEHEARGRPQIITFDGAYARILPAPERTGAEVRIEAVFRPSLRAAGLPAEQYERHIEAIADGAKARLLAAHGQPYSDAGMAGLYEAKFRAAALTAQYAASRGYGRARSRVPARFF